jgi:hypothetical protein
VEDSTIRIKEVIHNTDRLFIENYKENIIDKLKARVLSNENILDIKLLHPYKSKILNDFNVI